MMDIFVLVFHINKIKVWKAFGKHKVVFVWDHLWTWGQLFDHLSKKIITSMKKSKCWVCHQIKMCISLVNVDNYHSLSLASIILRTYVPRAPKGIFGSPRKVYTMIMFTNCFYFSRMFPSIQIHKDIVGKVNHYFLLLGWWKMSWHTKRQARWYVLQILRAILWLLLWYIFFK